MQLQNFPDISVSTREEHRVSCHHSRRAPFPPPPFSRGLDSFHTTQGGPEVPISRRDETRVSRHNSRRAPCFPPHLEMRAHSLLQLKTNLNFPSHHKKRPVSPIECRVEPHGSCCKEKGHQVPPQLKISGVHPSGSWVIGRGNGIGN